ncbi:hypothetical protein [Neisseria bacilliformis]|uniref:hypothetical protein n=1 Tax=Neisseria bacilliformis TaxID=267212 RepID=UPI003C720FC9
MAKFGMTLIGVIPAQAGILRDLSNGLFFQELSNIKQDFRLRGNDGVFWVFSLQRFQTAFLCFEAV